MQLRYVIATLTTLVAASTVALAQPGPPAPEPPPPAPGDPIPAPPPGTPPAGAPMTPPPGAVMAPPPAAPDPHAGVDPGVMEDAASSASFFTPTALTHPAGTFWFSDVDLFFLTAGYAITNELQVSVSTVVPVSSGFPVIALFDGKYQFLKQGPLRLAAQASLLVTGISETSIDSMGNSSDSRSWYEVGDVGGAATVCFESRCGSHASLFVGAAFSHDSSSSAVPLIVGASVVGRVGRHVRLIGEIDTGYVIGNFNDTSNAYLFSYGIRFTSKNIGVDFGFSKVIADGKDVTDQLPVGIPYLGFTYRGIDD